MEKTAKNSQSNESDIPSVSSCSYDPTSISNYNYTTSVESDSKEYEEAIIIECGNLIEEVLCCFQQLQGNFDDQNFVIDVIA